MIRAFDRFYYKHPKTCFAIMIVIGAIVLYYAYQVDLDNAAKWYWASRGQT